MTNHEVVVAIICPLLGIAAYLLWAILRAIHLNVRQAVDNLFALGNKFDEIKEALNQSKTTTTT